ncbi:DUF4397 domain-containing protein [Hymenobacter terrigena]
MKTSSVFRRAVQAVLPATLLLAACSKSDTPAPTPAPDQGRLSVYHMAASANVGLKFLFDDVEKASLNYGQNSLNQALNTGSRTIKVNVASSGANVDTKTVTVEKDKNYSYFAYSTSGTQLAGLVTTDDLTAPSAGKAKIRLVHLGQGAATPLKLSATASSAVDVVGTETQFASASPFIEVLPGSYNVAVTSGAASTVIYNVGDGNGTSTNDMGTIANKTYEAGKIYTVVYRGLTGTTVSDPLKLRAVIVQNN